MNENIKFSNKSMELDLRTTSWILQKVRESDVYAQYLYAAMCNNEFELIEDTSIKWSCSWRYSGEIISDIQYKGCYIDWYCSGNEGVVTDEIKTDLEKLGWVVVPTKEEII